MSLYLSPEVKVAWGHWVGTIRNKGILLPLDHGGVTPATKKTPLNHMVTVTGASSTGLDHSWPVILTTVGTSQRCDAGIGLLGFCSLSL